jgi:hypothetical protein
MKIAITSAPNLDIRDHAESLGAKFQCPVFENPANSLCRELGFQTLYDIPTADQIDIRLRLMAIHGDQIKPGSGVHMTSVIDMLADWARWMWSYTTTEKWDQVLQTTKKIADQYDAIYWIKTGPSLGYNGYDWLDQRNSAQINALIPFFVDQIGLIGKLKVIE